MYARRTRSFSVRRIRFSNSARMNKFDFTTEKIGSVHMTQTCQQKEMKKSENFGSPTEARKAS